MFTLMIRRTRWGESQTGALTRGPGADAQSFVLDMLDLNDPELFLEQED